MATMVTPGVQTEQRVILHGVSWETYERLLADMGDSHAAHFAYDGSMLEIFVPGFKHETLNRLFATLVEVVTEELQLDMVNAGSTTFKRQDLRRGFEPDTSFYIHNVDRVQGKEDLDLAIDPPPDLVIEIDVTSPSLHKLPIYAAVGVPEIWHYNGVTLTLFTLDGGRYESQETSKVLPGLTAQVIAQFVVEGQTLPRPAWLRQVRAWVQAQQHRRE